MTTVAETIPCHPDAEYYELTEPAFYFNEQEIPGGIRVEMSVPVRHAITCKDLQFDIFSDNTEVTVKPFQYKDIYGPNAHHPVGGVEIAFDGRNRIRIMSWEYPDNSWGMNTGTAPPVVAYMRLNKTD